MAQSSYGRTLYRARKYEEAIPRLQRAIELEPQVTLHAARLADVYEHLGRIEDAHMIVCHMIGYYFMEE